MNNKKTKTTTTLFARENFSELINQVCYGESRIILTRRKKPVAALVSLQDFSVIENEEKDNLYEKI